MSDDAIREAALRALQTCCWECALDPDGAAWRDAGAVIDAVRPLIEADLRDRLAAAIEAACKCFTRTGPTPCLICGNAARIVRSRP